MKTQYIHHIEDGDMRLDVALHKYPEIKHCGFEIRITNDEYQDYYAVGLSVAAMQRIIEDCQEVIGVLKKENE